MFVSFALVFLFGLLAGFIFEKLHSEACWHAGRRNGAGAVCIGYAG